MNAPGVAGASSIAAARGRLDRLGRVPVPLRGPGPLGFLTGEPLAALTVEGPTAVAAPALEDVLALVESPGVVAHPIRAPVARAASAGGSGGAGAPRATAVSELASALVPRAVRRSRAAPSFGDRPHSIADAAPAPPDRARPVVSDAAAPGPVLSRSARLGAATPVGMPTVRVLSGTELVAGPSRGPEAAPTSPARRAHPRSQPAAEPAPLAETSVGVSGTAVAPERASPGAPPSVEARRATAGLPEAAPAEISMPREPGAPLSAVPIEGLSGLVSWWDARGEAPPADGAGDAPASTRRAAASRSTVADPEREAPRTAEGAFEGSPLVRLSLRSALEELLLAEARASGIEVHL